MDSNRNEAGPNRCSCAIQGLFPGHNVVSTGGSRAARPGPKKTVRAISAGQAGPKLNLRRPRVDTSLQRAGRQPVRSLRLGSSPERIAPESLKERSSPFVLARCCGLTRLSLQGGRRISIRQGCVPDPALTALCRNGTAAVRRPARRARGTARTPGGAIVHMGAGECRENALPA